MAERPVIAALRQLSPDVVQVQVRVGAVEHHHLVRADRRPPLTVLVADDALQAEVRDWPELYRELMGRCRELLRESGKAVAA